MSIHEPVLTAEALAHLAPDRGGLFVDCTVGLGGHTRALLEAGASRVIGLDRDADALALAARSLAAFGDRVELVHADYRSLARRARRARDRARSTARSPTSACRRCSSTPRAAASASGATSRSTCGWIAAAGRPRRISSTRPTKATSPTSIFEFGEERHSRRIARAIVEARGRRRSRRPASWRNRPARRADARLAADRPGDAHVSGAADLGERRARRARRVSARRRGPAAGGPARRRHQLSTRSRTGS